MRDDIDKIMEIMEVAFDPQWGEAWNRRQISDSLAMPHNHYSLINDVGDTPTEDQPAAGFSLIRVAPGEEELLLIAVHPELRKKGLGKQLLRKFACDARARGAETVFLEMRANNPAEALYRAIGFTPIGRREQYYRTPDGVRLDAITFALKL